MLTRNQYSKSISRSNRKHNNVFVIIEVSKEAILDFPQGIVRVFRMC